MRYQSTFSQPPPGDGVPSPGGKVKAALPRGFFEAVRRVSAPLSKDILWVRIAQQRMWRFSQAAEAGLKWPPVQSLIVSTSRFGIGQEEGSLCTPLGLHRIARKIGGGWPTGTVFKGRQPIGYTWKGMPEATITTRILWLEGLEPGFNQGGSVDTFQRYIYIHGVGDETTLGKPASRGCVHVRSSELILLYNELPVGTLVWISRD